MVPEINRLKKKRDFDLIIKHGHWVGGGFLTLKYLELAKIRDYFPKKMDVDKFEKQLKLAFSVGLKLDKRAVVRNRVRRQIREVARLLIKAERIKSGYYLMFVPKSSIKDNTYAEISQEVELLLQRAGVLAPSVSTQLSSLRQAQGRL
ncbi:MAG: ribonuclease P protein component [Candidatus Magasanikbacteria bacterium]|jgi:ribonuclease P protein component